MKQCILNTIKLGEHLFNGVSYAMSNEGMLWIYLDDLSYIGIPITDVIEITIKERG